MLHLLQHGPRIKAAHPYTAESIQEFLGMRATPSWTRSRLRKFSSVGSCCGADVRFGLRNLDNIRVKYPELIKSRGPPHFVPSLKGPHQISLETVSGHISVCAQHHRRKGGAVNASLTNRVDHRCCPFWWTLCCENKKPSPNDPRLDGFLLSRHDGRQRLSARAFALGLDQRP